MELPSVPMLFVVDRTACRRRRRPMEPSQTRYFRRPGKLGQMVYISDAVTGTYVEVKVRVVDTAVDVRTCSMNADSPDPPILATPSVLICREDSLLPGRQ